ncbi:hypothetical protein [Burkholderia gladioli]|uniref:hypothetical protein n=1 Tax=Burkholderia gladioli TaxID=28095 RepID=UPI0015E764FB|nr:hypothetical protein [Burkholderia gladioli]MBA1364037.1 hypothetical protein [Burkholderia gladioli]
MTVNSSESSISWAGDGATTVFPFTFPLQHVTDLFAQLVDTSTGNAAELVYGTDFTVTLNDDQDESPGGSVTYPISGAAMAPGFALFANRDNIPIDQQVAYAQNDKFPAKVAEQALDKLTMIAQKHDASLGRAIQIPTSDATINTTLPPAASRSNKALLFNDSGAPITGSLTIGSVQTPVVDNRTMLRAVAASTQQVFVAGADAPADGGGGLYVPVYDPAPSGWDDDGMQITTTAGKAYQLANAQAEAPTVSIYVGTKSSSSDSHAEIQKTIDRVYARGGGIAYVSPYARGRLSASLDILPGVTLSGRVAAVGSPGTNASAPYGNLGGALLLDSDVSLNVYSGASIAGMLIYPYGMSFPQLNAASWTGEAVKLMGDDTNVLHSMILGFGQAIIGGGVQRPRISHCKIDCVNGVDLEMVQDVALLEKLHFWPFACIAATSKPSNWSDRLGAAINLHDTVDWANVLDCFAYNYNYGAIINGVAQTTLSNFKTDGPFTVAAGTGRSGTVGVLVEGNSVLTRIIDPQINSAQNSLVVNIPRGSGYFVSVDGGSLNSSGSPITGPYNGAAVLVQSGDVKLNTRLHYHSNGLRVTNADSIVTGNIDFGDVAQDVVCDVPTTNVYLNKATFGTEQINGKQVVVGQSRIPTVSTASGGINLPMNAEAVFATAEAGFGAVSGGYAGRIVTIIFSGSITVFSQDINAQTNIRLLNNADWTVQAGYNLTIQHDGRQWREIGRTT